MGRLKFRDSLFPLGFDPNGKDEFVCGLYHGRVREDEAERVRVTEPVRLRVTVAEGLRVRVTLAVALHVARAVI